MTPSNLESILIHIDAETPSRAVLDCAVELADAHRAHLTIVDVIPDSAWPARLMTSGIERAIESITQDKAGRLNALAEDLASRGVKVKAKVLDAPSSVAIVREVIRDGHDMVIRETKGKRSRRSGFFGTTSTRLLRKCPCALLLLKPGHPFRSDHVLAAVDATAEDEIHAGLNERILETAKLLCDVSRQLDVVCAWTLYGESVLKGHMGEDELEALVGHAKDASQQQLDELMTKSGVARDNTHLLHGHASEVIPKFIKEHDTELLILGTIGRTGMTGLLIGNTAEQILSQVDCSVLAVKPEGFVSPIHA